MVCLSTENQQSGGSPNHALYLLGCVEEEVLYLDPHTTQPASQRVDASYHVPHPGRLPLTQLDPSLALCFLCITETEFDNLCIAIQVIEQILFFFTDSKTTYTIDSLRTFMRILTILTTYTWNLFVSR